MNALTVIAPDNRHRSLALLLVTLPLARSHCHRRCPLRIDGVSFSVSSPPACICRNTNRLQALSVIHRKKINLECIHLDYGVFRITYRQLLRQAINMSAYITAITEKKLVGVTVRSAIKTKFIQFNFKRLVRGALKLTCTRIARSGPIVSI